MNPAVELNRLESLESALAELLYEHAQITAYHECLYVLLRRVLDRTQTLEAVAVDGVLQHERTHE